MSSSNVDFIVAFIDDSFYLQIVAARVSIEIMHVKILCLTTTRASLDGLRDHMPTRATFASLTGGTWSGLLTVQRVDMRSISFFAVVAALTHIISRPTEVIGSPTGPEEGIYVVFLPVVAHMGIFSKYYVDQ
jgi:hypothetical protein